MLSYSSTLKERSGVATFSKRPHVVALTAPIRAYQYLSAGRLSPCRFYPSCSAYALESIETHGALRGLALALRRILRCHPFGGHGVDPVPSRES
jgi:putative membrane protein insertion efficiency factor